MPMGQQTVNVLSRVRKTVLVEHPGPPGQADTGEPIVLGDDNISWLHPVDQGKIHAVSALVKDQRLGTLLLGAMGLYHKGFVPACRGSVRFSPSDPPPGSRLRQSKWLVS